MDTFKERLLVEQMELQDKMNKLSSFVNSPKIDNVEPIQKSLLKVQLNAMSTYNECLIERLSNL
jgi:hypothetical protein